MTRGTGSMTERSTHVAETMEVRQRVARALMWVVGALLKHDVPYQVVGGLAARAYGAHRPLADIDLYVPFDQVGNFLRAIQPFVTWGPEHYDDETWDLTFLKINYGGQRIELGDSSTAPRFFNVRDGCWERQQIDYLNPTIVKVYGLTVEVMPKDELIRYKAALGRAVDLMDITQMNDASPRRGPEGD